MASLRKMRGKWYVRIRYNGKEKSIPTYHTNRRDAEIVLRKYQQNEQEVKLGLSEHLLEQNITIDNCIKYFLMHYQKEYSITISTMDSYKLGIGDFQQCFSYIRRMSELQPQHYPELVDYLKRRYNDTTVNIRLRGIRVFLNYLVEKEYIRKLPFKVKQIRVDKHPPKFITPEELDSIYSVVDNDLMLFTFKVFEVTGMRVGELANSHRDGDFIIITKTKGKKDRIVPLPYSHILLYDTAMETAYSDSHISHEFSRYARLAGVQGKTIHCLRHTFAYRMLMETNNLQLTRDLLGHSSVKVTEIYTQVPTDYLRQVFVERGINQVNRLKVAANA